MAQELELIVDLLKEMRRANNSNIDCFDKLLASINNKLDLMDENEDSIKLIKAYLAELTKTVDEKYSTTVLRFNDIEKALNSLFEELDEHAKTKNMLKAYNTFSKNMAEFYSQIEAQKETTAGIEKTLTSLKNNKEDIKKSAELLKETFEQLNNSYKNITNSLSSNLKPILTNLAEQNNKKVKTAVKKQTDIIGKSINEIITYLKSVDEKGLNLEKLLNSVATNERLKFTEGVIDLILEKSENISDRITSLAAKSDIEELQNSTETINNKLDSTVSKKEFENITLKTEALVNQTDEVKQKLAKVTQNIEELPSTKLLEESLQKLFQKLENLSQDIENYNVKGDVYDLETKLSSIKEDLSTVKNIVIDIKEAVVTKVVTAINDVSFENESYDIKHHISKMLSQLPQKEDIERIITDSEQSNKIVNSLIEKTDTLSEKLETLATQQDIQDIKDNQSTISQNMQELSNKDDISSLLSKTDEIEQMIDKLNFDSEFDNIYNKASSIEEWLESSKIKENTEELTKQIQNKAEKEDISTILSTINKAIELLEKVSETDNIENCKPILSDAEYTIEDLKTEIINNTEFHNDSVITKLSEIQTAIGNAVSIEDFNSIAEDLKAFTLTIVQNAESINVNIDEIKQQQQIILEKLENIDFSHITDSLTTNLESFNTNIQETINSANTELTQKTENIENKLTSISEYLNKDLKINEEEILREISEIKEILQNKKSNFDGIELEKSLNVDSVEGYLEEIKTILDTSDKGISEDVKKQLATIETELNNYKAFNENQFTQILEKLGEYEVLTTNEGLPKDYLSSSISEITEIKDQIQQLGESFASLDVGKDSTESTISSFVSEKLQEITDNLSNLTDNVENGLQQGFAYNAELIEEKSSALLDFIKELRHASTGNIDLYERLTVTDNKLMDFKQELELINTDVISNLNSKTDKLLKELSPIKELITCLAAQAPEGPQTGKVQEQLGILHDSVQDDITECTKYAKSTFDRLEETYEQISKDLTATERNLRDFILGDIDSVIIKVDNLKSDLESTLNRIAPPDAEQMEEFHAFVAQINTFKDEQKAFLNEIAEDIKTSISNKMTAQHDEIKSMLTVAVNNEEIVHAIENLKRCFKSKIKELSRIQKESIGHKNTADDFDTNQYEEVFEGSENAKVIEEIKEDFNKFSSLIGELSGENSEIEGVLNSIREKIDTITVVKAKRNKDDELLAEVDFTNEESEDNKTEDFDDKNTEEIEDLDEDFSDDDFDTDDEDEILIGANNFDFMKAFDLLKQDITNLRSDIERVLPQEAQQKTTLKSIPSLGNDNLLMSLNNKVELLAKTLKTDWLEEIKSYLAGGEIHSLLEDISDKINILTLTDNSEWIQEIKQALDQLNSGDIGGDSNVQSMLALINEKIDILASSDDHDLMEDVRDVIERIYEDDLENQSQQNESIKKLLNTLDQKIDIIATSDNYDSIEDIKESLETLENKFDAVAGSEYIEVLKDSLVQLEEKIDTISESANYGNLTNIQDSLEQIECKLESLIIPDSSDNNVNIEDIKYTLLGVDEKIDEKVQKLSESDAKITSMLEELNHKIDTISGEEGTLNTQQDIDDVKHLILAQMDYIERLEHNNKTDAVKKCLKELTLEVNNLNLNSNSGSNKLQKTLKEMKESIMAAVVTIFEQVSFVEETEDIKDFVEEKTDVINQNLVAVTKQLRQITNSSEDPDYTYSMQDIESDLAKLRLALNELQNNELENQSSELANISDSLYRITTTVEDLQSSMTQDEIKDLKSDISNLQEQTQKLLITSDESYNALNSGLEDFGKLITNKISNKVDKVTQLLEKSSDSDKVMRQALIYMGEWIDSASESMDKISTNSDEIVDIKTALEGLKEAIPEQTDILNSIEEKFDEQQERLSFFEKQINKLSKIEDKFEEQQERIDRLEMTIEKVLNAVEDIDDSKVTRKIDKIDKQLAKLSTNIEKLASYVD